MRHGTRAMLLFLDFDGVLHPEHPGRRANDAYQFCRLPLLEGWLRLRPGVDVVISSSWREAHPLDELVGYFSVDLQSRVVGCTPAFKRDSWQQYDGEPPPVRFPRETEVLRWLATSSEPWRGWAGLDDQAHLFKPLNPRLVLCDPSVGLTARELARLDTVLGLG